MAFLGDKPCNGKKIFKFQTVEKAMEMLPVLNKIIEIYKKEIYIYIFNTMITYVQNAVGLLKQGYFSPIQERVYEVDFIKMI